MFKTISAKAALLAGAIAAVAVIISGLVAMPLIRDAAELQAQAALAQQADLVQNVATNPNDFDIDPGRMRGPQSSNDGRALLAVVSYLAAQGIEALPIIPGTAEPNFLTSAQISAIANGSSISGRYCKAELCSLVEARPVGTGTGIVLVQPTSITSTIRTEALKRIGVALVIGFATSVLVGFFVARRLTKPLKDAADAARRLGSGDREVQLPLTGPTELTEISEALNVLATELKHSEGRQREFLLSISHELRTPLTAIRGYAEAMQDGVVVDDEISKIGGVVNSEAIRLDRLVADLLDLARSGAVDFPLHLQEIDLRNVLIEATEVWADRAAREDVVFESEICSEPVLVKSDAIRIRQILDNLAENALRVTPSGQKIIFALSTSGVIQVRDSGPGLSPEDIQVAFQPGELYERYKGVRRVGTGFGLALVGRLAHRLGATATAGISPEGGAAFTIDFSTLIKQ